MVHVCCATEHVAQKRLGGLVVALSLCLVIFTEQLFERRIYGVY